MGKLMYMVMLEKSKSYNRLTKKVVTEHVDNIRRLDERGSWKFVVFLKVIQGWLVCIF